jgi:hypothetical protein
MRATILAGLALSIVLFTPPPAQALGGEAQWCRLERDAARGGECIFYTYAQCAASTERLNGGGCYQNPFYRGGAAPAAIRGVRRHKPRHDAIR